MRSGATVRARVWLGGLAAGGVAVTHWLAYRLTLPTAERAEILSTGPHRYWPLISAVALGALVAGLAGFAGERLWRGGHRREKPGELYRFTATGLMGLQTLGWTLLEATERLFIRGHDADLLHARAFLIGLLIQVVVALIGALLLVLLARVVHHLVDVIRRRAPVVRVAVRRLVSQCAPPRLRLATGGATLRGPPPLV